MELAEQNHGRKLSNSIGIEVHAYKKRFFILSLFCAHSAINSFQWIQYSSITNVIGTFYGVSNLLVNLTSLVYMITYIPFIIHASLLLERIGLRLAVVLGTLGTALGSFLKWSLGGSPGISSFWWMMSGQTIVALSQLFIISIPPLLAAVWFPDHQVSTATGIGVFGNQLGIALGFIVPPWIVAGGSNNSKESIQGTIANENATNSTIIIETYGQRLNLLSGWVFCISLLVCLVSLVSFKEKPPKPASSASLHAAQQKQIENGKGNNQSGTFASIKELSNDADFRYLVLSYGINVGVFYAISTVLSQMVTNTPLGKQVDLAGMMGLLIVLSGMLGSVVCGQLLDRTHAYKLIIVLIYLFSLFSMLLFAIILEVTASNWTLYLASLLLGFFMTGYLPLGFEFAAEITYPQPANTPAGLLNLSAQVFGLLLTYVSSLMVDGLGNLVANGFLTSCLALGLLLTIAMKADLKRQNAVEEEHMKAANS